MVGRASALRLINDIDQELTLLESGWAAHMTLVDVQLFNAPKNPQIKQSTPISEALEYLKRELTNLNFRIVFHIMQRYDKSEGGEDDLEPYTFEELLVEATSNTPMKGAESDLWHFKRTLSAMESILKEISNNLELKEEAISVHLKGLRKWLDAQKSVETLPRLQKFSQQYEDIQLEYLYHDDEEKFEQDVAQLESRWKAVEQRRGVFAKPFVSMLASVDKNLLKGARDFAKLGYHLPRQQLITEFFTSSDDDEHN